MVAAFCFRKSGLFAPFHRIFSFVRSTQSSGEDFISGERKHKDPFSFKPYARFMYSCNDIPKNYGDRSEAFYRRLIIIRFSKPVPEDRRDLDLKEKLAMERDGILTWAITGLKRLISQNYQFSETERTKAEVNRYKVESNSVLSFAEECCELDEKAECLRQELYDAYKLYCEESGLSPMSNRRFNRELETISGVTAALDTVTRRKTWRGIRRA